MFDRIRLGTLMFICLALPFIGCGSSNEIDSIVVSPSTLTFGGVGLTAQLTATATIGHGNHPSTTEDVTKLVTWSTGSADVATVSSTGLVTSVGSGSIQVTASINGFTGMLTSGSTVNVTATSTGSTGGNVVSVSIIPGNQTVDAPGETGQFIAIGTTSSGASEDVTTSSAVKWSTSSSQVATITGSGLVTAVSKGTVTVSAVYTNADKSVATGTATFTVDNSTTTAEQYTAVSILPATLSVASPGQTGQYIALATLGSNGTQVNVTNSVAWSSSVPGVATIGASTGLATAVGQGTTAITAILANPDKSVVTGSATFSVTGGSTSEITALTIIPGSQTVTIPLTPSATPSTFFAAIGTNGASGLEQNLTNAVAWSSSDTAVATIDHTGAVTVLGQGSTTITAQYTNQASGSTAENVVTATASLQVSGVASEPLLSIALLPGSESIGYPGQTSQLIAIGSFASAPVTQNLTTSTTYPLTWSSSNASVATVTQGGLVTAIGQGSAVITAIASNPDKSVVTGVATVSVSSGSAQQITGLTIIPGNLSLSATGQPGQFIALGTSGTTGLEEDVTNSPQLAWSSSVPTYATVSTYPAANPGQVQGVSAGTTTITAEWTNPATATTAASQVAASSSVTIAVTPAAEPLLSIAIVPTSITDYDLLGTGQYLAYGTFSTAPTLLDITNGFSHPGFPAGCTSNCPTVPVNWVSTAPYIFPVNSAGAQGATGGLVTADGSGTADIYATAGNPDGTLVYSSIATFNCPYAAPTYGTTTTTVGGVTTTVTDYNDLLNPGTCNTLTIGDSLLSTLTVFGTGLNTSGWLITAPSATGTPDVIHCGGSTEQSAVGGSVCEATYPNGTVVTLTAPAESGVNFGGWSSNCTPTAAITAAGPNSCTVVVGGGCTLNPNTGTYMCSAASNISVGGIFN